MAEKIFVNMLGIFSVKRGKKELSETKIKTRQMTTLLAFLIVKRNTTVNLDNVYSVLWPNEDSDNPAGALRNLIYRLRVLLKESLGDDLQYITTLENNSYAWNPDINIECDYTVFENFINSADASNNTDEQIQLYSKAVGLYQNHFLDGFSGQDWVKPVATYYKSKYDSAAKKLAKLMLDADYAQEALDISLKAAEFEPLDESLHRLILFAYSKLSRLDKVREHYKFITALLNKELGVRPAEKTIELYRKLTHIANKIEVDIKLIREKLLSLLHAEGEPLFCDYDTFTQFFDYRVSTFGRSDEPAYLVLLTISTKEGRKPPKDIIETEMERLKESIKACIRRNDIAALYSSTQYILLLKLPTQENAELVKTRIQGLHKDNELMTTYSIVAV